MTKAENVYVELAVIVVPECAVSCMAVVLFSVANIDVAPSGAVPDELKVIFDVLQFVNVAL